MKKVGITVAAAVCVVLLCVGFYFMKNSDGSQASKENCLLYTSDAADE